MKYLWVLFCVGGCSGSPDTAPKLDLPPGCEPKLADCLAIQQICVAGPACQACPDGQYADKSGVCKPIGTAIVHDFPDESVAAGGETYKCRSWTLNNDTELWINAVELEQDASSHHSNWFFVPDDFYDGADGIWYCGERNFDELAAALKGGVLYAQSTQAAHEVQKFPDGAALRIPPWSRIVSDDHLLNATQTDVTGHVRMSLYPVPLDQVKVKLAPFHLGFRTLNIPPMASSRSQGSCDLEPSFENAFNHGVDAKVYYILPHFHALGFHFFVDHIGGPRDGQNLFDSNGGVGEARGRAFDPPLDLSGDTGLTFGCDFDNPTAETVGWGFGNQEMCELLGFSGSPLAWTSQISQVMPDPTGTELPTYTGPCTTIAFEYDFTKPGGPGPR